MTENKPNTKEKKFVFPSAKIGIEEEFLPSTGTHVENHEVRASVFGEEYVDRKSYRAKVFSLPSGSKVPRRYDTVIGVIVNSGKNVARIDVIFVNGKPVEPPYSATMHISDSAKEYVKALDALYKNGDVIRATVIDAKSIPIQLECKKSNTGVVYALCEKCGEETTKLKRNSLKCNSCGWKQTRNTAMDYGRNFAK